MNISRKMTLENNKTRTGKQSNCHKTEETASHVLCDLKTLDELRINYIWSHFTEISDYHTAY
jgi:hypothetical protein